MSKNNQQKTISVPEDVLGDMVKVYEKFEEFSDKLEDFIISSDEELLEELKESRKDHLSENLQKFDLG